MLARERRRPDPRMRGRERGSKDAMRVDGGGAGDVLSPRVLREYALVADGERGALIGPDGSVTWLCVPRWDSPAAFSGLLGGPGRYTITPADPWHVWGGHYEPGSLIWRSRWVGDSRVECREHQLRVRVVRHCAVHSHRCSARRRVASCSDLARGDRGDDTTGSCRRRAHRIDQRNIVDVFRRIEGDDRVGVGINRGESYARFGSGKRAAGTTLISSLLAM